MAKRRIPREAVKQTPKERLFKGNKRIIGPNGKTTWLYQGPDGRAGEGREA